MNAIVKYAEGYGNLKIQKIPRPMIKNDEVLIEIKAAGICGSDIHHYKFGARVGVPAIHQMAIPVVLGHEFSGDVIEIGSGVKGWKIGEKIVAETHAYTCGNCHLCRSGNYHLCAERKGFGSSVDGAFAEYLSVPARLLHRIPKHISYTSAAVLQPTADVVHAVINRTRLKPGDSVAVIGPGPMGLLAVSVSKAVGAGQVIIIGFDRHKERFEVAKNCGANDLVNLSEEDLIERINELTSGRGVDIVFESSGSKEGFLKGLEILARKGQMTIIGVPSHPVEIDLDRLFLKEQTIRTSIMSTWRDYEQAVGLVAADRLDLETIISHVLPMNEWQKGFDLAISKKGVKIVFTQMLKASQT